MLKHIDELSVREVQCMNLYLFWEGGGLFHFLCRFPSGAGHFARLGAFDIHEGSETKI